MSSTGHIQQVLAQRLAQDSVDLLGSAFDRQREFIQHPARLKALFCTRRAAKSYTAGLYLIKECLENPGVNCLFVALTRLSAQGIIWKDILKTINTKFQLGIKFNESKLTATLRNGSVIWVTGIDTDEEEMEKLLGKKYRLAALDEASLYSIDARRLVYGILKPAVADNRGTILLLGTACDIAQGLFYDITTGKEPGWELFQWTALDNPFIATQWQEELNEIALTRPLFMETPLFKQWYLNQWVVDIDKLVYKFNPDRNYYDVLPHYRTGSWNYVLGVDLGYHPDPSAFVVVAFHDYDKNLYVLESHSQLEMDITDVANKIKEYHKKYEVFRTVIDNSAKQAVEEMIKRHNLSLTPAEKQGKVDFIELMNAEMIQGIVKVARVSNAGLVDEWMSLVWVTEGDKIKLPRKEHPGLANHRTDAALYAWRFCYNFLSERPKQAPTKVNNWPEISQQMAEESLERQIQEQKAEEDSDTAMAIMDLDMDESPLRHYLNKKKGK